MFIQIPDSHGRTPPNNPKRHLVRKAGIDHQEYQTNIQD